MADEKDKEKKTPPPTGNMPSAPRAGSTPLPAAPLAGIPGLPPLPIFGGGVTPPPGAPGGQYAPGAEGKEVRPFPAAPAGGPAKSLPPLPGLPGGPQGIAAKVASVLPPLPPTPAGMGKAAPPPMPPDIRPRPAAAAPQAPQAAAPSVDPAQNLQNKISDLEKRLQEEHEKVLLASLRSQEEQVYASKVEMAIKEVQDKLRRDRRESEMEESRLKLESKIQELEERLIAERETWVTTLKGQVRTREVADKEIESHFALRMQEMERRWMEEKAHWQKALNAKDDEIRNLRALAEKLKGADLELQKAVQEKKLMEERVTDVVQDSAEAKARVKALEEREREYFQVKAELMTYKEQVRMLQDKLDRDVQSVRQNAKEREDRLIADNDRLSRDMESLADNVRREMDLEVKKYQAQANVAKMESGAGAAANQRLKSVAGALERQLAAAKAQLDEALRAKRELEKANERFKAEFMVLQRRWQDREREIKRDLESSAQQKFENQAREFEKTLEAEKAKARLEALEQRASGRPQPPNFAG